MKDGPWGMKLDLGVRTSTRGTNFDLGYETRPGVRSFDLGSEPFRSNESHDEIDRQCGGHSETEQGFEHRCLLEPAERVRIERKHDKAADAGGKKK